MDYVAEAKGFYVEWNRYDFCKERLYLMISRLFEKEEIGYTWYDGWNITYQSVMYPLYEDLLNLIEERKNEQDKASNSDS